MYVSKILVSTSAPFQLLSVISLANGSDGLELDPEHLIGQSIVDLTASSSDKYVLQNAIVAIENGQQSKIQLTFSGEYEREQNMMVTCSPYQTEDFRICCHIALNRSFAVSLHEAFQESSCPRALISSESPHVVHMINHHFAEKFGIIKSEILGRPLGLFKYCPSARKVVALLRSALNGRIVRDLLNISAISPTLQEDIIFVPVCGVDHQIKHVLVLFAPSTPIQQQITSDYMRVKKRRVKTSIAENSWLKQTLPKLGEMKPPRKIPVIYPRRKLSATNAAIPLSPVAVTPELVRTLSGMSLAGAAAAAGVSPTAFKKACRKIGIRRWTYYRRHDGHARSERARDEQPAATAAVPASMSPSERSPWLQPEATPAVSGASGDLDPDSELDWSSTTVGDSAWDSLCASAFSCAQSEGPPAQDADCGDGSEGAAFVWSFKL